MLELTCFDGSFEEALGKVTYSGDVKPENFSPVAKFGKGEMAGVTATYPGADLPQVLNALFGPGSGFVRQWREAARGDKEFEEPPWGSLTGFSGVRVFKCKTKVTEIFTSWVNFIERQRFVGYTDGDTRMLQLHFSSQTPSVTLGENFRIESLLEFTESSDSVTLKCSLYIHFLRGLGFIEGKVTSVGTSESIKSYQKFCKLSPPAVEKAGGGRKKKAGAKKASGGGAAREAPPPPPPPEPEPTPPPEDDRPFSQDNVMRIVAATLGVLCLVLLVLVMRQTEPESATAFLNDPTLLSSLGLDRMSPVEIERMILNSGGLHGLHGSLHGHGAHRTGLAEAQGREAGGYGGSLRTAGDSAWGVGSGGRPVTPSTLLSLVQLQDTNLASHKSTVDSYVYLIAALTSAAMVCTVMGMMRK